MQFGSGWWFLDQKDGMQKPLLLFIKDYFIEKKTELDGKNLYNHENIIYLHC